MTDHANYIFSTYKTILSLPEDQLLRVGYPMTDGNPIPSFDEDLLINLCANAQQILENEGNILEIEGDVIVVGDIHGSFHDLLRIFNYFEIKKYKVLFLGDYVDRGDFSIECITLLLAYKILYPQRCFLIRGNHEFDSMCSQYGFKKEFYIHDPNDDTKSSEIENGIEKVEIDSNENSIKSDDLIGDEYYANYLANVNCYVYTEKLYKAFMRTFSYLPFCAIINNTSICIHGGLSPVLKKIDKIQTIQRPIDNFDDNQLLSDILWGDPSQKSTEISQLFHENPRGRGKLFTGMAIVDFLKINNFKRLIRAHECVNNGTDLKFNDKCITVFSASSYNYSMGNRSGVLKVVQKGDRIEPVSFPPLPRLSKSDADYYKVQHYSDRDITKPIFSVSTNRSLVNSEQVVPLEYVKSDFIFDKAQSELSLAAGVPLNKSCYLASGNSTSGTALQTTANRKSRIFQGRFNINQNFAFNTGIKKRKNSICSSNANFKLASNLQSDNSCNHLQTNVVDNPALPRLVTKDQS